MRFVMINLFLVCLLLFGISYLAFSHDDTVSEGDAHHAEDALWGTTFQTFMPSRHWTVKDQSAIYPSLTGFETSPA